MVVYLYSCHICLLGKGSVLTNKGGIEMDAIIMEGSTLKTGNINKKTCLSSNQVHAACSIGISYFWITFISPGAVAGISNVSNPVTVARLVMETTPHILLAGPGANIFAQENDVPFVENESLITKSAQDALAEFLRGNTGPTNELG